MDIENIKFSYKIHDCLIIVSCSWVFRVLMYHSHVHILNFLLTFRALCISVDGFVISYMAYHLQCCETDLRMNPL